MNFEIKEKVALVTGGASGIGLAIAEALIVNGAKGVALADINPELGNEVVKGLNKKYGANKSIYIQTNVTDSNSFENAFKKTIECFKHLDMLFNNAGVFDEVNWEKCVDVNLNAVINGTIMGIENYLSNYNKNNEAVIVNTASIAGLLSMPLAPVYAATKFGIIGLTKSYGNQLYFEKSKVRTIAFCPGATETPILQNTVDRIRPYGRIWHDEIMNQFGKQSADFMAKEVMQLVKKAPTGSVWIIEDNKPAYEYIYPEKNTFEKNTLSS